MNCNKLIIFDIDGTLTNTNQVDSIFFEKAILESLPILSFDNQWHNYKYATSTGLLTEIIQSNLNRDPNPDEIETIKEKFISQLENAFTINKMYCSPIDGAQFIFESLFQLGWDIGIATGCWEKEAVLKLKTADIPYQDIPIAHSDDHMVREEIISIAIKRAKDHYKKSFYSKIIYVGDKMWDKNAARNIGIGFIGVGSEWGNCDNKDFFHVNDFSESKLVHYLQNQDANITELEQTF